MLYLLRIITGDIMGHQVELVFTEDDVIELLAAIEHFGGAIVYNGLAVLPTDLATEMISKMKTRQGMFAIINATDQIPDSTLLSQSILTGRVLELSLCTKGNPDSRTYEVGRLYLAPNIGNGYDQALMALYNNLKQWIRKEYCYSKTAKVYYSIQFKSLYDRNYYHVHRCRRPITL